MVAGVLPDIIVVLLSTTPHTSVGQCGAHRIENLVTTREMEVHFRIPVLVAEGIAPAAVIGGFGITGNLGSPVAHGVLRQRLTIELIEFGSAFSVFVD